MKHRRFLQGALVLAAVVLLAGVVGGCGSSGATQNHAAGGTAGREVAPSFSGTTMDGMKVSSEGFKGKPLVLVFWASW